MEKKEEMKKRSYILVILILIFVIFGFGQRFAKADEANFSVMPILPKDTQVGYFDLVMNPGAQEKVSFQLSNNTNKEITINTSFGTAFTGSTGTVGYSPDTVKPDSSLKYNIEKYVSLPQETKVSAHSSVVVSAMVSMPKANFTGQIAGGFNFKEKISDHKEVSNSKGMIIKNEYRYVVGLILQQNRKKVAPTLDLSNVFPSQRNDRNVISAHLTNSAMAYLMDMNAHVDVSGVTDPSIKYKYQDAAMKMAPNSSFDLAIPISVMGAIDGQHSTPLKPGKYHLSMTVFGQQNEAGKYDTQVNGKVVKYLYQWKFEKDFTVSEERAKILNAKDVTVKHSTDINWIMIVGVIIIVLLIIIILILFFRKNKEIRND